MNKIIQIVIAIFVSQSAGLIGSIFTAQSVKGWYTTLQKPFFNPPGWIFGPVWIMLYTLMGISSYLIWQVRGVNRLANPALIIFGIHLLLNTLWSILFFGLKTPGLALLEIVILWLFIVLIIFLFYKINKTAAYLLIPYLFWVSFASILNFFIWRLN